MYHTAYRYGFALPKYLKSQPGADNNFEPIGLSRKQETSLNSDALSVFSVFSALFTYHGAKPHLQFSGEWAFSGHRERKYLEPQWHA